MNVVSQRAIHFLPLKRRGEGIMGGEGMQGKGVKMR